MKKEQEELQQKSNSAHVGNHVGSNPPAVVSENHVPHHAQPTGSKSLLAKVGLSVGSDADGKSSVVASALAGAGVDSALVGGGHAAAMVHNLQRGDTSKPVTQPAVEERAPAGPTKLPPSMTSPPTTTAKKKDVAAARRGETPRFSQLLDARVIDDHFDQYITAPQPSMSSRPSVAGRGDDFPAFSYDNRPSASNEVRDSRSRALQRRKTLPGRPPGPLLVGGGSSNPGHRAPAPTLTGKRENEAISFVARAAAETATAASAVPVYRKPAAPTSPPPRAPPIRLRKAAGSNRGSMPDVSECAVVATAAASPSMPREEVHVLSLLRREELRRIREEADRRHQQDIILRLGDIKVGRLSDMKSLLSVPWSVFACAVCSFVLKKTDCLWL